MQRPGKPQAGPGNGTHRHHLLIQGLGFLEASERDQQFAFEAQGIHGIFRLVVNERVAGRNRGLQVLCLEMPVDVTECPLAQQDAREPAAQQLCAEGLDHVVVRRQLGRGDHFFIIGFRRDHHEDGLQRDQVAVTQFLQQLLAIASHAQVEVAQDKIIGAVLDLEDGLGGIGHHLDLGDPEVGQGQPQGIAHTGRIVHHQCAQGTIVDEAIAVRCWRLAHSRAPSHK